MCAASVCAASVRAASVRTACVCLCCVSINTGMRACCLFIMIYVSVLRPIMCCVRSCMLCRIECCVGSCCVSWCCIVRELGHAMGVRVRGMCVLNHRSHLSKRWRQPPVQRGPRPATSCSARPEQPSSRQRHLSAAARICVPLQPRSRQPAALPYKGYHRTALLPKRPNTKPTHKFILPQAPSHVK